MLRLPLTTADPRPVTAASAPHYRVCVCELRNGKIQMPPPLGWTHT